MAGATQAGLDVLKTRIPIPRGLALAAAATQSSLVRAQVAVMVAAAGPNPQQKPTAILNCRCTPEVAGAVEREQAAMEAAPLLYPRSKSSSMETSLRMVTTVVIPPRGRGRVGGLAALFFSAARRWSAQVESMRMVALVHSTQVVEVVGESRFVMIQRLNAG